MLYTKVLSVDIFLGLTGRGFRNQWVRRRKGVLIAFLLILVIVLPIIGWLVIFNS
jgi:hypothetical protein